VLKLSAIHADITTLDVDAIVNAADNALLGGGGVDGAIHAAAGPELLAACRNLKGCETGDAKITEAYRLPARYVIHAVGPVWSDSPDDPQFLASCYIRSLEVARDNDLNSVAFSCISTGVYGYPKESAAEIAIGSCLSMSNQFADNFSVIFCCFSSADKERYERLLKAAGCS